MKLLESAHPYFELDWLMSRAWISLCAINELLQALRHCPDVTPFACWHLANLLEASLKTSTNKTTMVTNNLKL